MYPRSKHWDMVGFIITRQENRQDILSTRVMRGAECRTDHLLARSKVRLNIKKPYNKKSMKHNAKLNVAWLRQPEVRAELQTSLVKKLLDNPTSDEIKSTSWNTFKEDVYNTSLEVLGKQQRKHQDWFDENSHYIETLIGKRNQTRLRLRFHLPTRSTTTEARETSRLLQIETKQLKSEWWQRKAEEI